MKLSLLYACTLSFPIIIAAAAGKDGRILTGTPHSTVQVLEQDTFETALSDPANGLWLLKFYAPWCGHCKQMAPTLDKMAPYVSGKLAIGKIDCTTQKPLCKEHGIKGYPTLKIYRDGDFFDYPGRRDADSMIEFAEKMSKPAVTMVNSAGEILNMMQGDGDEVVFVAYDVKGKEIKSPGQELTTVEKILASSTPLQIFGQVARQLQAESSTFVLLNPTISKHELPELNIKGRKSFIAKLEDDMDPVIYDGGWESPEVLKFAKEHKLPTIVELNSHNFRSIGHMGKPLAIGIYNPNELESAKSLISNMKDYVKSTKGQEDMNTYRFAKMDGVKWSKFLSQFSITQENLPQILVLDVPGRIYYRDDSIAPDMNVFMTSVQDGTIERRVQETGAKGPLEKFHALFVQYMPFSLLFPILVFALIFVLTLPSEDDIDPYYPTSKSIKKKAKSKSLKED